MRHFERARKGRVNTVYLYRGKSQLARNLCYIITWPDDISRLKLANYF